MDAADLLRRLAHTLDAHAWDDLPELLTPEFTCRYVHTGEVLDAAAWVRLNRDYPGFESMVLEDLVGDGDRAVSRARVLGRTDGVQQRFEVATFITAADGRIDEMVEVWTDVDQTPPDGTR